MEDTRIIIIPYVDEKNGKTYMSHGVGNNTLQNYVLPTDLYGPHNADGKDENGELYFDIPTEEEQMWMDLSEATWDETKLRFRAYELSDYELHMLNKKVQAQKECKG